MAKTICPIEALGIKEIDYKDTTFLRQYITKFNKIVPRYYSGVSLKNQRKLAQAIKRARCMALLPYVLNPRATTAAPVKILATAPVATEKTEDELM
ncbi:30S ribosomal protein S18 [Candidatus Gracilibacteria bacterium CG2_30_37_12]|nr:MAG: 30S ribosomal protein S18 [Candidatus Gracilibacteria bacterium CG2_30_37_12]